MSDLETFLAMLAKRKVSFQRDIVAEAPDGGYYSRPHTALIGNTRIEIMATEKMVAAVFGYTSASVEFYFAPCGEFLKIGMWEG